MTDFASLFACLYDAKVDFVVIGGIALVSHGHARFTADLDICPARTPQNNERLAKALQPFHPHLRGMPADLPFVFDARTLANGLNFTLRTDIGDVDVMGEIAGVGGYDQMIGAAETHELYGRPVSVIGLKDLERAKVAAGRPKDLLDVEAIRELLRLRG